MLKGHLYFWGIILLLVVGCWSFFFKLFRKYRLNQILFGLTFETAFLFLYYGSEHIFKTFHIEPLPIIRKIALSGAFLIVAFLFNSLLDLLVWRRGFGPKQEGRAPQILIHLSNFFVYLVAGLVILRLIYDQSITGLAAASGMIAFVLGYSANPTLGEIFSGVALNLTPSFKLGDVIRCNDIQGKVHDMNWRSVVLQTLEGYYISIPNSSAARADITNLSVSEVRFPQEIIVPIDYTTPVAQAISLIEEAVREVDEVERYYVTIKSFETYGILYQLQLFLTSKAPPNVVSLIRSAIYYKIRKNPLVNFGYDKSISEGRSIHSPLQRAELDVLRDLVGHVDLFQQLTKDERSYIANNMIYREFGPPEKIISQGEEGHSMFVIQSGRVNVSVAQDGARINIAELGPKEEFGIMSLLTGAPRSATCRASTEVIGYEITKDILKPIFEQRPDVVNTIAEIVAKMEMDKLAKVQKYLSEHEKRSKHTSLFAEIKNNIFSFFGLSH